MAQRIGDVETRVERLIASPASFAEPQGLREQAIADSIRYAFGHVLDAAAHLSRETLVAYPYVAWCTDYDADRIELPFMIDSMPWTTWDSILCDLPVLADFCRAYAQEHGIELEGIQGAPSERLAAQRRRLRAVCPAAAETRQRKRFAFAGDARILQVWRSNDEPRDGGDDAELWLVVSPYARFGLRDLSNARRALPEAFDSQTELTVVESRVQANRMWDCDLVFSSSNDSRDQALERLDALMSIKNMVRSAQDEAFPCLPAEASM